MQYLLASIAVATIIATIYVLPVETAATAIIALLILVHLAMITVVWGARVGALSAVIAFLFFNYFFTQPYFEFSIQPLRDIGILVMFLLVTVLANQFAMPTRFVPANDQEMELINILVSDLPGTSRRELTAVRPKRQWKILSSIIGNVLSHMEQMGVRQSVETEISKGLPLLFVDPAQMEYVFTGLINNISKYRMPGTPIHLSAWAEAEFIHIRIDGQSHPLPYEEIKDILDQLNPGVPANRITDNKPELFISQNIINAHGGLIWAENTSEGLAFHFALPLR